MIHVILYVSLREGASNSDWQERVRRAPGVRIVEEGRAQMTVQADESALEALKREMPFLRSESVKLYRTGPVRI